MLTACIVQAANAGCTLETKLRVPEKLPFEETDLCVILSNTLENAIHACRELPEDRRRIVLRLELTVAFRPDGLPESPRREGHGLGLQSVKRVTDKYGGLFRCQWEQERFLFRAVLMPPVDQAAPQRGRRGLNRGTAAVLAVLAGLILLNCLPELADTLEAVPVLGWLVRAVDLRTYALVFWRN